MVDLKLRVIYVQRKQRILEQVLTNEFFYEDLMRNAGR